MEKQPESQSDNQEFPSVDDNTLEVYLTTADQALLRQILNSEGFEERRQNYLGNLENMPGSTEEQQF